MCQSRPHRRGTYSRGEKKSRNEEKLPMIMLRGAGTIRTSRNLKGHRSLVPAAGFSQAKLEAGRLALEEERLAARRR